MANVIVLAGGSSNERDVSLRSGAAVTAALKKHGHVVRQLDSATGLVSQDLVDTEVIFPVLHGEGGEDGALQAHLDKLGVPYVGSGAAASALCFDKWQYKQLLREHGLSTPKGALVTEDEFWKSDLIRHSFVLKPNDGGSSIDNLIARGQPPKPDPAIVKDLFERYQRLLLEELIEGVEITVAVLGEEALPVIEIIPPSSGEFDYENKYNGQTQELCPPVHVTVPLQQAAQALAVQIHTLCGCRDFSRTDLMIDASSQLYVLETNTIPGMTDQSLFPKAAAAAGIPMEQLVDRLVSLSLQH